MAKAEIVVGVDKFKLRWDDDPETDNLCCSLRVDGAVIYFFADYMDGCERLTFSDWAIRVAMWMITHKVFEFDIVNGRRYLRSDEAKECGVFSEALIAQLRDYIEREMSTRIKYIEEVRMMAGDLALALRDMPKPQ